MLVTENTPYDLLSYCQVIKINFVLKNFTDDLDQLKYRWVGGGGIFNGIFSTENVCSGQVSIQEIKRKAVVNVYSSPLLYSVIVLCPSLSKYFL